MLCHQNTIRQQEKSRKPQNCLLSKLKPLQYISIAFKKIKVKAVFYKEIIIQAICQTPLKWGTKILKRGNRKQLIKWFVICYFAGIQPASQPVFQDTPLNSPSQ